MKYILSVISGLLLSFSIHAQPLALSPAYLDFGNVFEDAPKTLNLQLTNHSNDTLHIAEFRFYMKYGEPAFSSNLDSLTIYPGVSEAITVTFSPLHNVYHNSEMVLIMNDDMGSLSVDLRGQGKYSISYFAPTENLEEQALKSALKTLLTQTHSPLSYNAARDEMYMVIDNQKVNGQGASVNTVEGVYTGQKATNYSDRQAAQNQGFNTEHTVPQSLFSSSAPMKADLFHIFVTQQNANSIRSNYPFGYVTGTPTWSVGGSKLGGGVFEPRDVHKGQTARAVMYFVTRYQDYDDSGGTPFYAQQDAVLRQWHELYPPTQVEKNRSQAVFNAQGNRNPFSDYPQFTARIHQLGDPVSTAPIVHSMDLPSAEIDFGTINTAVNDSFYYTIVNNGNQQLSLQNFILADQDLWFANNGGSNTSLDPGEALTLGIVVNTTDTLYSFLNYETNVPGMMSLSVPIKVRTKMSTGISYGSSLSDACTLYPIPATDRLNVRFEAATREVLNYNVYNIQGTTFMSGRIPAGSREFEMNTSGWMPGCYVIRMQGEQLSVTDRFLIAP